jgi:hypothetical protein
MKKSCAVSLLCLLLFSCGQGPKEEYPLRIDSWPYSYIGENGFLNMENHTVVAIHSAEEFENCFSRQIRSEGFIDFSLYTLLLATGDTDHEIAGIKGVLTKLSGHEYVLDVLVRLQSVEKKRKWYAAVLVPRLSSDAAIGLNLEIKPPPDLEHLTACGVLRPHENLPWLVELIEKGGTISPTGVPYRGTIWLTTYRGQEVFVTDMNLNTAYMYHKFDCEGNGFRLGSVEEMEAFYHFDHLHLDAIPVYSNRIYY